MRRLAVALAVRLAVVAVGSGVSVSGAVAQETVPAIIDMHLHALPIDGNGPPPVAVCAPFVRYPLRDARESGPEFFGRLTKNPPCDDPLWSPETDEDLMRLTLEVLERRNIVGVTSGPIDNVERWYAEAPDRIIPALSIAIGAPGAPTPEQLREWYEAGRFRVLGEVTSQYLGISLSDPVVEPYLALAEELDIPLAVHVGPGPPGAAVLPGAAYRARLSSALQLEGALIRHPNLRIYAMHAGWPLIDDMLAMLYAHAQLYVDLGVISFTVPRPEFHGYLRRLVEAGFGDRIMFGSDQMQWPGAIEVAIEAVESAPFLTSDQKRDIFYNNAVRFLRLEPGDLLP